MIFTPGGKFLGCALLSLLCPCAFIAGFQYVLDKHLSFFIPAWLLMTATALGAPTVLALRIALDEINQRRRAAALGARLVPRVIGSLPGNLDVLMKLMNEYRHGYPCEIRTLCSFSRADSCSSLADAQNLWAGVLGSTFNLRVFWEDIIFTDEPDNIKVRLL